jgi:D-beta-D-heptose 7-phosphate kinase / D-beta-D-heptose 1-phosphate adenosyltransferase
LDTRKKILTVAQAVETVRRLRAEGSSVRFATGWFDPLIAAHARRLEQLRDGASRVMVIVTDPSRPILPARARAELVAALSVVDFVVPSEEERLEDLLTQLEATEVLRGEADDETLTQQLIHHVQTRQRTA